MSEPQPICPQCGFQLASENFCPKCGTANSKANLSTSDIATDLPAPSQRPKRYIDKRRIIVGAVCAGAIMAIIVASYSINTYALSRVQFRSAGGQNFDFTTLSAGVLMEACNPTSFPASFDKYHMVVLYKEKEFASMDIDGAIISPNQSSVLNGKVAIDRVVMADLLIQAMADRLPGNQMPEFNQDDMAVRTTIEAKVLGVIPYAESKISTMKEFQQISSKNSESFSCQ